MNPLQQLHTHGQSPYLDDLRRALVTGGVRGLTSNLAVFEVAIAQRAEGVEPFGSLRATLKKARDEAATAVAPQAD